MSSLERSMINEMFIGRRGRLRTYAFEIATALAFPLVGIVYLIDPTVTALHSPIAQRVYPFDYVWSVGYILGGLLVFYGALRPRPRWRVIGLITLGTALAMQTVAAVLTNFEVRELFNGIYAAACFMRAALVSSIWRRLNS